MLDKLANLKIKVSHSRFCFIFCTLLYTIYNGLNFEKLAKWFYLKDQLDYSGFLAFFTIGLCGFLAFFSLVNHHKTAKFFALFFVISSGTAVYFTTKYNVVIDRTMLMNLFNTDKSEASGFLTLRMLPYFTFLILLPSLLIWRTEITFDNTKKYLLTSLKIVLITLTIGISLTYTKFESIHRAANLSKKYILHTLVPINIVQSFGSIVQHSIKSKRNHSRKEINVTGEITKQENLVVVLAIGETSRQKSFQLYGYDKPTNPLLSKDKQIHALNGIAKIGSTLYALPQILTKDDVTLVGLAAKLGVKTNCYVNYTLYDNCDPIGETAVKNCGHDGNCFDEDVIPLLRQNLAQYKSGYNFVVLHLGGGSHGPSYHERYPPEFQKFQPICKDADVVNQCSKEQLYNSFDNTILYVDYVVSNIISELDKSKLPYVFMYLSDHGESLLEDGRIFHGMPPGISLPEEQARIPLLVKSSIPLQIEKRQEYQQQDIFDTILNLFSAKTSISEEKRGFIKK